MSVAAVRAVHMAVIMIVVIVIMIAVRAVDVRLLGHAKLLRDEISGNYLAISRQMHAAAE